MALYIRDDLASVQVSGLSTDAVEVVIVKIWSIDTLMVVVYRPPNTTEGDWTIALNHINESVELTQAQRRFSNLVMVGDFNLPAIRWDTVIPPAGVSREARAAQDLLSFAGDHFLRQSVCQPTRGQNVLDLIFVDNPQFISHIDIQVTEILSDHNIITAYLGISLPSSTKRVTPSSSYSTTIPSFNTLKGEAGDWVKYREEINTVSWADAASDIAASDPNSLNLKDKLLAAIM